MNRLSLSKPALCPARLLLTALAAMVLGACSGSENSTSTASTPTVLTPALFAFYDSDNDTKGDSIARIDLSTDTVMKTAVTGVGAGAGMTDNQAFYDGPLWVGSGPNVWGIDPDTLQVLPRPVVPSIQGNREGTIGSAIVNALSLVAGFLGLGPNTAAVQLTDPQTEARMAALSPYFGRTSASYAEVQTIDFCAVQSSRGGVDINFTPQATQANLLAAAIVIPAPFHNMGYSPVDIAPTPDGKLTMFGVRMGDHALFLDTDPNSPTFGYPVRFVYPRLGKVKDQNNAVVATFAGLYTPAGGTAPGKLFYDRVTPPQPILDSEVDKNTYTEPCDSTTLRNSVGQVWSWWPDVQGDTITGSNDDSLRTATPQVAQVAVPIISRATAPSARGGNVTNQFGATVQRVGPRMATLMNRNAGNEFIMQVENEGDNSQSLWDVTGGVTDPTNLTKTFDVTKVFEIERVVMDLKDVLTPDLATQTGGGTTFTNGATYTVSVSYASTGGATTSVNYKYVSLPGDNFLGATQPDNTTHAYLQKVTATDPGPKFILNGLYGRASTAHPNIARIQGSGTTAIMFGDESWLMTFTPQPADGIQIIGMKGLTPPYLITEFVPLPSAFTGLFSPDGTKFYQLRSGGIDVIDAKTRTLVNVITLPGPATALTLGSYHAPVATTTSSSGGGTSSGGGSSGGGGLPPNPCGG